MNETIRLVSAVEAAKRVDRYDIGNVLWALACWNVSNGCAPGTFSYETRSPSGSVVDDARGGLLWLAVGNARANMPVKKLRPEIAVSGVLQATYGNQVFGRQVHDRHFVAGNDSVACTQVTDEVLGDVENSLGLSKMAARVAEVLIDAPDVSTLAFMCGVVPVLMPSTSG